MSKKYDSREGIEELSKDLAGLSDLVSARSRAGYDRGERMEEWIVRGRLHLDTCGNAFVSVDEDADFLASKLGTVASKTEYSEVLAKYDLSARFAMRWIPSSADSCDRCRESFTVENFHDAVRHTDGRWFHTECEKFRLYDETSRDMDQVLAEAGFSSWKLIAIPNGYHTRTTYPVVPWFIAKTCFGDIVVGARKRVYSLDWSRSSIGAVDFSAEKVTCEPTMVHAWSRVKLVEYLRRLRDVADKKLVKKWG